MFILDHILGGHLLSRVVGQRHAKEALIKAHRDGFLAHAYLLHGDEGSGAEELALEFARYLQCDSPTNGEPCGNCRSCSKVMSFQHPDVHYYFPVLKSTTPADWRASVELKIDRFYEPVRVGGGSIHIGDKENPEENSIRGLIQAAGLQTFEGKFKIFIVTFCEEMNAEAANALLKILEEPPKSTLFLLTTTQLSLIIPTIRSRCQSIKLRPVSRSEIREALKDAPGETSDRIANLSDGNYLRALLLKDGRYETTRQLMLDFLRSALSSRPQELMLAVDQILQQTERDKGQIVEVLQALSVWLHDVLVLSVSGDKVSDVFETVINRDLRDSLQRFMASFPALDIDKSQVEVEKAVDLISRNVYLNLTLVNLGIQLRRQAVVSHSN